MQGQYANACPVLDEPSGGNEHAVDGLANPVCPQDVTE
jgi:hypothetical protein